MSPACGPAATKCRQPWRIVAAALCLLAAIGRIPAALATPPPTVPPNILLIVADDLGYGDLGCYGATRLRTPHLDALASSGLRFTQFRVNPLCSPTRVSLLSGLYPLETGLWRAPDQPNERGEANRELRRDVRLLPEYLKDAGYATGLFGKWHLGYRNPNLPTDRGFGQFVGFLGGAHPYEMNRGAAILQQDQQIGNDDHLTDLFTERAIAFVRSNAQRPFFCCVTYNAVHGPMWQPERPRTSAKPEWLSRLEQRGIDFPHRDYFALLEHLDHSVGRLIDALDQLKLRQRTLVIFLSDNGALEDKFPGDNGPLRGQKGTVYEGGIRVPAIFSYPGLIPAGATSNAPAMVFDIFSTCLEAAGVEAPHTNGRRPVHGLSLLAHARSGGREPLPDRWLFWDLWGKLAALHDGWKLVGQIDNHRGRFAEAVPQIEAAQFELYYLPDDVAEQHDLAAAQPEVYRGMKQRLLDWFRQSTQ